MDVALGVLLGIVLTASVLAVGRLARTRRVLAPGEEGVRAALHAAATTLPHLRRGLTRESAGKTIAQLHALTQAVAVAIADSHAVLAFAGEGAEHVRVGEPAPEWLRRFDRIHVEPRLRTRAPQLPFGAAVIAPLVVQDEQIGWLAAFYGSDRRLRPEDTRVVSRGREPRRRPGRALGARRSRRSASRTPSCARCAPRSRRTSSTTRSPRSPTPSTRGPRRRASS